MLRIIFPSIFIHLLMGREVKIMLRNEHIKPTESVIYFEPSLNNNSKVNALVEEGFLRFNRNKTGYMDLKEFTTFIKYGYEKGLIRKGKLSSEGIIAEVERGWTGPKSKREVYDYVVKNFHETNKQTPSNDNNNNNGEKKPIYENLITDILPNPKKPRMRKEELKQICDEMFNKYDANKTGFLDYLELTNLLKIEFNQKYSYFECLKMCDKNKDGMVSPVELLTFIEKAYS